MSRSIFERYRDYCHQDGVFVEHPESGVARSGTYSSYRVNPAFGSGWMDFGQVGRDLTVGRAAYEFRTAFRRTYEEQSGPLGIFIVLAGRMHISAPDGGGAMVLSGGSVWLRDRRHGPSRLTYDLLAGDRLQGVSIDLPASFVHELLEDTPADRHDPTLAGLLRRGCSRPAALSLDRRVWFAKSNALLTAPTESTVDRLRLEAGALDLVAALLGSDTCVLSGAGAANPLSRRQRAAVDDVLGILRQEFSESHTIAALAARVGLNQCYLKTAFRAVTGSTIATHLRDIRMRHARDMIEGGRHTVQEAALFVGYANPSHFAAAFRKAHGVAPSSLR